MPIEMKDLDGGMGIYFYGSGVVTGKEYINAIKTHLSQDRDKYRRYRYCLSDYSEVIKAKILSSDIQYSVELCKKAAKINPEAVIATVAKTDIAFGFSRMWEILLNETNWEIMVFRKREDAETWIRKKVKEKYNIDNINFS